MDCFWSLSDAAGFVSLALEDFTPILFIFHENVFLYLQPGQLSGPSDVGFAPSEISLDVMPVLVHWRR